jgi:aldose 1-epimerase
MTACSKTKVDEARFGTMPDGREIRVYTLHNSNGLEVRTIPYGAIVVSIKVPDRQGLLDDIVIGHDTLEGYLTKSRFFGAVVGRYGNRIAKGRFTLDGQEYSLAVNNGPNHLHGGTKGFDKVVWEVATTETVDADGLKGHTGSSSITYHRVSPDGEEGYPGQVDTRVTYTLTAKNELVIEYVATTDKATPINLTNHSYFNLAGDGRRDITDHVVTLNADRYLPVDDTKIPLGHLAPVEGTPFDFRQPTRIGKRIDAPDPQLAIAKGYDHCMVLTRNGPGLVPAAHIEELTTGRTLDVATTEPGMQFYTGNVLDGSITGKSGHVYKTRYGLCLETQHFPNSPNQPDFPSTILRPGEKYASTTVFTFGVKKN